METGKNDWRGCILLKSRIREQNPERDLPLA
jgi:hypothetical protein